MTACGGLSPSSRARGFASVVVWSSKRTRSLARADASGSKSFLTSDLSRLSCARPSTKLPHVSIEHRRRPSNRTKNNCKGLTFIIEYMSKKVYREID